MQRQSSTDKSDASIRRSRSNSITRASSEESDNIVNRMERNRKLIRSAAAGSDSDGETSGASSHKFVSSPANARGSAQTAMSTRDVRKNEDTLTNDKVTQSSEFAFLTVSSKGTKAAVDRSAQQHQAAPNNTTARPAPRHDIYSVPSAATSAEKRNDVDSSPKVAHHVASPPAHESRHPYIAPAKELVFTRDDLPKPVRYTRAVPKSKKAVAAEPEVPFVASPSRLPSSSPTTQYASRVEAVPVSAHRQTAAYAASPVRAGNRYEDEEDSSSAEIDSDAESLSDDSATETDSVREGFAMETFSAARVVEACDQRAAAIIASIRPPSSSRMSKEIECDSLLVELEAAKKREKMKSDLLAEAVGENKETADRIAAVEKELEATKDLIKIVHNFVQSISKPLVHEGSGHSWGLTEVKVALEGTKDATVRSLQSSTTDTKEDALALVKNIESLVHGLVTASETDEILKLQTEAKVEADKSRAAVRRINEMADQIGELEDERDSHLETIRALTESVNRLESADATCTRLTSENQKMSELIRSFEMFSAPQRHEIVQSIASLPSNVDNALDSLQEASKAISVSADRIAAGGLDDVDVAERPYVAMLINAVPNHAADAFYLRKIIPSVAQNLKIVSESYKYVLQRLEMTNTKLSSSLDSVGTFEAELSKYKTLVDPAHEEVRATAQKLAVVSASMVQDKKDKIELLNLNSALELELAQTKAELSDLKSSQLHQVSDFAKKKAAYASLERENENLLARISALHADLKVADERREAASAKMIAMINASESETVPSGFRASQVVVDELKGTIHKLEAEIRSAQDEKALLQKQIEGFKEGEKAYLEEIQSLRASVAKLFGDMKDQQNSFTSRLRSSELLLRQAPDLSSIDTSILSLPEFVVLCTRLQAANKEYEVEVQRLREQASMLNSEVFTLRSHSADVIHELEDKTMALQTLSKLKMESESRTSHEVEINLLAEQAEAVWKSKLENAEREFSSKETDLKGQVDKAAAEIERLSSKLKRFASENNELTQKIQDMTTKSEREHTRQKRSDHSGLLSKLITPIEARPTGVPSGASPVASATASGTESSASNPALEAQIVALTNNLQLKAITIRDLTKSLEDVKAQSAVQQSEAQTAIETLRNQVADLEASIAAKSAEMDSLQATFDATNSECIELRQQVSSLSDELRAQRADGQVLQARYDALQERASGTQERLEGEVSGLKHRLEQEVSALQFKLDEEVKMSLTSREREVSGLQRRHEEQISLLQGKLDAEVASRSSAIDSSLAQLKTQLAFARTEHTNLTTKFDKVTDDLASLRSKFTGLTAEKKDIDGRVVELKQKLAAVEAERDDLQSLTENLSNTVAEELNQKDAELDKLKERLRTDEANLMSTTSALKETKKLLESTAMEKHNLQEELEMLKNTHKSVVVAFSHARDELSRYS